MKNVALKPIIAAFSAFLIGVPLFVSAQVSPLCSGATDVSGTCGNGDNIIRLINPNGAANGLLAGAKEQTVCAMIYVFDDDQEMGECCGCPLSSAKLATFSVQANLTSDWAVSGGPEAGDHLNGTVAVVASAPNTIGIPFGPFGSTFVNTGGGGPAGQCLGTACCDPTNQPGYSITTTNNLLGSITHNQIVVGQVPHRPQSHNPESPKSRCSTRPLAIRPT